MRKFRFSFVISSSKDIHQIIPPSFHKLLLIEMTCKKWCPCFTLHLYFFLFTILASIREFFVDQIVFLFFCRSFLLAWWLFSYQQYSFTWKTRPTSGHCFHHHTSLSIVWHSVCKSIYIYIYIYWNFRPSSRKPRHSYVPVQSNILTQRRLVEQWMNCMISICPCNKNWIRIMVSKAIFNNISVISWRSF